MLTMRSFSAALTARDNAALALLDRSLNRQRLSRFVLPDDSHGRHGRLLAVLALTLLAAALRLHDIALDGFWKNELFSLYWIRNSFRFIATQGLLIETNPPLHYVLLKLWTMAFGTSELGARSLSALASIACVPLMYALGRDLGGARVGLIAAAVLAVSPVQIVYAQEARSYALLPLFMLVAMLGACRLLREARSPSGERRGGALLYVAGTVGLLYSHATAPLAVAALAASVMLAFIDLQAPAVQMRRFVAINLVVAVFAAPVVTAMFMQVESPNIDWMPRFGLERLLIVARMLMIGPMVRSDLGELGSRLLLVTELGLAVVTAILLFAIARGHIGCRRAYALVVIVPLLFLVAASGVSLARPILIPRITIWLTVPICLSVAFILTSRAAPVMRALAGWLMAICLALGLWNNSIAPAQHKPDWRALLRDNPPGDTEGPLLVAGPHAGALGIAFYSGDAVLRPLRHWNPQPDRPPTLAERLERAASGSEVITTQELVDAIGGGRGVRLYLDGDDEGLITSQLLDRPEFAQARLIFYPGLIVFDW
jgi:mannosyltransferase